MADPDAPELKIFLNQSQSGQQVYYPGQSVSGSIQIVVREPRWYEYVGVGLEGKGEVHWPKLKSDEETYVDQIVIAWGSKEAPQPTKLDPGTSTFPFQFTIPADCPPTFQLATMKISYLKIKYRLYCIVSSQVKEYKIETALILKNLIDLNLQPNLLQPIERVCVKNVYPFCCICCSSGAAEITFKMQKTGFCVGREQIQVSFDYRNGGSCPLTVCFDIRKIFIYVVQGRESKSDYMIKRYYYRIPASGHGTSSVKIDRLPSPEIAIDTRIMKVTTTHYLYFMVVESHRMGMENAGEYSIPYPVVPQVKVPITLGNVPFQDPAPTQPNIAAESEYSAPE